MGFPRQEYWSGLRFPSPGHLPNSGIKPQSSALAGRFFTSEQPGKPILKIKLDYLGKKSAIILPVVISVHE